MIKGVSERAGGVPLFVEEVTRLLLERGEQGGAQAIPPTLRQSLAARLDRLGSAREVAQIGAVLGRSFSYPASARRRSSSRRWRRASAPRRTSARPATGTSMKSCSRSALDGLVGADLLFVEGVPPEATYRFKHALIQDAAYDSLLKSRRQALHRRAAKALIEASGEPEAIAHHFTEAGLDDSRSTGGARRARRRCAARPTRRRSPISARRSRWPTKRSEQLRSKGPETQAFRADF